MDGALRRAGRGRRRGGDERGLDWLVGRDAEGLLTAEEERELARRVLRGDASARRRMIEANLRLVAMVAARYRGLGLDWEDLVGEGNLGLIRAVSSYDPDRGVRFSTYAAHWIRQTIRVALTTTAATIRLPAHMVTKLALWRRAEARLTRNLGRSPTFEEVADELGWSSSTRLSMKQAMESGRVHHEEPGATEGRGSESRRPIDQAVDPRPEPAWEIERRDELLELRRGLQRLGERERLVLALRYGLGDIAPKPLREVATTLGVTREWVRRIEARALRQLHEEVEPE